MSSSNCCFLTCIQISPEAHKVVWYSCLLKNFPVCCDPHIKDFSIVNEAEVDFFCGTRFFDDPTDVGNLISGSSAFSKSSLNMWKFSGHILLKPGLENFEHYFTNVCVHAKSLQLCPTLCNLMDSSVLGSSVHGIL